MGAAQGQGVPLQPEGNNGRARNNSFQVQEVDSAGGILGHQSEAVRNNGGGSNGGFSLKVAKNFLVLRSQTFRVKGHSGIIVGQHFRRI